MRSREYAAQPPDIADGGDGQRPLSGFMFQSQATTVPIPRGQAAIALGRTQPIARPALPASILELALSASGVALVVFMLMHLGLLFSAVLGRQYMDDLADFLEGYYLLQAMIAPLILLGLVHVFLAARKVPTTFGQQRILVAQMRQLGHLDTWTWAFQILSGAALLIVASIHLWTVLTDLPIEAGKSGARVFGMYLWLYIPFVLLVEGHISIGLYRVAVKWGLVSRRLAAHLALLAWTALVLALGFTILATLYHIGGNL